MGFLSVSGRQIGHNLALSCQIRQCILIWEDTKDFVARRNICLVMQDTLFINLIEDPMKELVSDSIQ